MAFLRLFWEITRIVYIAYTFCNQHSRLQGARHSNFLSEKGERKKILICALLIIFWLSDWLFSFETPLLDNFLSERRGFLTTVLVFLSLHRKEYFEYFIRQLRPFSNFPDVRFENFLFQGVVFDLEIGFQRLICWFVLKGLISIALRNILRDFSQCGRNQ